MLSEAGYLAIRHPSTTVGVYDLTWNSQYEMFEYIKLTSAVAGVFNGGYITDFDHAYANKGWYSFYAHPWQDSDYYLGGVNDAEWTAWRAYVGGRDDVWYTDMNSFIQYKYLREISTPVAMSYMDGVDLICTFTADTTARNKHGLSVPITYTIQKPAGWGSNDAEVYYKDAATAWTLMTEKISTDIFTGINAFRNDGTQVLASQGFPTESDYFELKLVEVP